MFRRAVQMFGIFRTHVGGTKFFVLYPSKSFKNNMLAFSAETENLNGSGSQEYLRQIAIWNESEAGRRRYFYFVSGAGAYIQTYMHSFILQPISLRCYYVAFVRKGTRTHAYTAYKIYLNIFEHCIIYFPGQRTTDGWMDS